MLVSIVLRVLRYGGRRRAWKLNLALAVFILSCSGPCLCYSISQIDSIPSIHLTPKILYPACI